MVFRAFLSLWFLVTSLFAPVLCCCAPFGVRTAHAAPVEATSQPTPAAKKACPHCKPAEPAKDQPTEQHQPCPSQPNRDDCPCKRALLQATTVDSADLLPVVLGSWSFEFPPVLSSAMSPHLVAYPDLCGADHTGPPPLAGVELLRHLHILIC